MTICKQENRKRPAYRLRRTRWNAKGKPFLNTQDNDYCASKEMLGNFQVPHALTPPCLETHRKRLQSGYKAILEAPAPRHAYNSEASDQEDFHPPLE